MTAPISSILRNAKPFHSTLQKMAPTLQSRLENGFRISSQEKAGETCTVGVWIDAGSIYETPANNGVAHYLEHMNFKGTGKRNRRDIEYGMERMGAHLNAYTSREQTCYYIKCFKKDTAEAVDILSDVLLNSLRSERDIEAERRTIMEEKEDVESRIDEVLMDYLHMASFEGSGAGLTILGPNENIERRINKKMIDEFVSTHYTGPRMVLVGSGAVDHAELCDLGAKYFGKLSPNPSTKRTPPRFIGGDKREPNEMMPMTHMAVAFGTPGAVHADATKIRIIEQLLGGYSKDKGEAVYSCMTRGVVANFYDPKAGAMRSDDGADHNPIHSIATFWTPYLDSGLLGFYLIVDHGKPYSRNVETAVSFGMREMLRITQKLSDEEFERAKNQLKVQSLLNLDGTTNIADDIGRQVLLYGQRVPLHVFFEQIDQTTKDDLIACARRLIYEKDPVAVAIGDLAQIPPYDAIRRMTRSVHA